MYKRQNPVLNAFRLVFAEQALAEADAADSRRANGESAPLLGVPIAVKDDQDIAGVVTAYGSNAQEAPAAQDSEIVRRLREAGAVIIGKTNVPELTALPFTETATFGVTRNPWDLQRSPGGSSGGSGAAVAAGLVGAATASDGAGSIRIPAAWCGLFGLKPQRGRVSMQPRRRPWFGMAGYGGLTRGVRDAALFLDVVAGALDEDADRAPAPVRPFLAAADGEAAKLRIAYSEKLPPGVLASLDASASFALADTVQLLRELGHEVVEREVDYGAKGIPLVVGRYLRGIHDEAEGVDHPERLERRTRGLARIGALVPASYVAKGEAGEADYAAQVGALLGEFDVLLTPGPTIPAPPIGKLQGRGALFTLNAVAGWVPFYGIWNFTGHPAAAVPAGLSGQGLPRSVQIVGRPADEATLISLAAQIESRRPWADERPPGFS